MATPPLLRSRRLPHAPRARRGADLAALAQRAARAVARRCARRSSPRPTPRACCAITRALVDRVIRGVWRECAMPREACRGRGRRLRPRPALPALRRRRADPAARRRSTPPARGHRALLRRAVGHRHRALARGAHDRRMRSGDGRRRHHSHEPARASPARRIARAVPRASGAASPSAWTCARSTTPRCSSSSSAT